MVNWRRQFLSILVAGALVLGVSWALYVFYFSLTPVYTYDYRSLTTWPIYFYDEPPPFNVAAFVDASTHTSALIQSAIWVAGLLPMGLLPRHSWLALTGGALLSAAVDLTFGFMNYPATTWHPVRAFAFTFCAGGFSLLLAERRMPLRIMLVLTATFAFWILLGIGIRLVGAVQDSGLPFPIRRVRPDLWITLHLWVPAIPTALAWAIITRPHPTAESLS